MPAVAAILPFGTLLTQTCWVVDDLEIAISGWLSLGVGPFYVTEARFDGANYRGKPVPLHYRVALAQAGTMQIELVQQLSDGPSAFRDVAPQGGTVPHHVCTFTDDYDGAVAAMRDAGIELANEFMAGDMPVCYADTRAQIGVMLEVLEPRQPILDLYKAVAAGAEGWDGQDPIRSFAWSASAADEGHPSQQEQRKS